MKARILANALVDRIDRDRYRVLVWDGNSVVTPDLAENSRTYTIHELSEDFAAQEGIRLFVAEISEMTDSLACR